MARINAAKSHYTVYFGQVWKQFTRLDAAIEFCEKNGWTWKLSNN